MKIEIRMTETIVEGKEKKVKRDIHEGDIINTL
jgi:hypothetical protein